MESAGYGKLLIADDPIYVQVQEGVVERVNSVKIMDFVNDYLDNALNGTGSKRIVKEALYKDSKNIFTASNLNFLKTLEIDFVKDTKEKAYFFYLNCFVVVTKDSVIPKPYKQLKGHIWRDQIIQRNFKRGTKDTVFLKFLQNVCKNDLERINSLASAMGYLLHRYKNPSISKSVIFLDEKISSSAFGRSGKGLVAEAIGKLRNEVEIDGKNFNFNKSFVFQRIELDTEIIFFDDIKKSFQFDRTQFSSKE